MVASNSLTDTMKKKFFEFGTDYFKEKFESSKDEFLKYVERSIERKIRREVRKFVLNLIFYLFLGIGVIFLFYGGVSWTVFFMNLPEFLVPMIFGLVLIIVSFFIYLQK